MAQMKAGNDLLMPGTARQQEALLAGQVQSQTPTLRGCVERNAAVDLYDSAACDTMLALVVANGDQEACESGDATFETIISAPVHTAV